MDDKDKERILFDFQGTPEEWESGFEANKIFLIHDFMPLELHKIAIRELIRKPQKDKYSPSGINPSNWYKETINLIKEFFSSKFFGWTFHEWRSSWRPMIAIEQPMHFDSTELEEGITAVTGLLNIDTSPRSWRVGATLEDTVKMFPKDFKKLDLKKSIGRQVRHLTQTGQGPINDKFPWLSLDIPPRAMIVFNANLVAHQVVHGKGAVMCSGLTKNSSSPSQSTVVKRFYENKTS